MALAVPVRVKTLTSCYAVPLESLAPSELAKLQKELTVQPTPSVIASADGALPESFPVYAVSGHYVYIPRFYGLERFGPPARDQTADGLDMLQGLECGIVLQPERSQPEAVEACLKALRTGPGYGGVLSLPCGFGKTETALKIAHTIGKCTLVIVNGNTVREEWSARIKSRMPGARVGIIQQSKFEVQDKDFVIALVHTVIRLTPEKIAQLGVFGLVIVDESHHMAAQSFSRALSMVPARRILALSATFRRTDGLDDLLHWQMGPMILHVHRKESKTIVIQIEYGGGQEYRSRNFPIDKQWACAQALQYISSDAKRIALVVYTIQKLLQDPARYVVVFSKLLDSLDLIHDALVKAGIDSVGYYTGKTSAANKALARTCRVVLCTVNMGKEGLDIPHLNALILFSPCSDIEQITGRILRKSSEINPLVFDIVDNFMFYDGLSWKRHRQYKSLSYQVRRTTDDEFYAAAWDASEGPRV